MFIAQLHYQKSFEEVQQHVEAHRSYLGTLYDTGKLIVSGPKTDKTGGLILFATTDRQEVENIIAQDPYHTLGLAKYELLEFHPVKYDPKFSNLYL